MEIQIFKHKVLYFCEINFILNFFKYINIYHFNNLFFSNTKIINHIFSIIIPYKLNNFYCTFIIKHLIYKNKKMNGFQLISKLGEGAYSTVLKVKRIKDGNIYALKKVKLLKLSSKEKTNALNEVRILASIKSNFVISYKEAFYDEEENVLGIVMEYADKGDLYQKISKNKKTLTLLQENEIWRILIQLIKGLKALHDLKILHRDMKSANVFLFSDGSAKLGDLNVSKVAKKGLLYTQTGTPYYASPEVWKDQPYNYKSDIWSLGCVLYEMITLKPPFRAENMEGLYNKVIKGQYHNIPSKYSDDLSEIVRLLLQVDPESRPSCNDLINHPIIKKRIQFFTSYNEDLNEDQALLKTILIPKNLMFLGGNLPEPNYFRKSKREYLENNKENNIENKNDINREDNKNDNNEENNKDDNNKENNKDDNNKENNKDDNNNEEDEEEKERLRIEKEREEKQRRREMIDLERKKRLAEEREKRERREKLEAELKIKENELRLKKELEEKERKEREAKYNILKPMKRNEVNKSLNTKNINSLLINNSQNKIILPDIRNSYDYSLIGNLNYRRPNYNGYNRSKKYKILLFNEEEEMNKLIKNYVPAIKQPINKKYIYAQNKLIHNISKRNNGMNGNGINSYLYKIPNQRYIELGKKNNIPFSKNLYNNNEF